MPPTGPRPKTSFARARPPHAPLERRDAPWTDFESSGYNFLLGYVGSFTHAVVAPILCAALAMLGLAELANTVVQILAAVVAYLALLVFYFVFGIPCLLILALRWWITLQLWVLSFGYLHVNIIHLGVLLVTVLMAVTFAICICFLEFVQFWIAISAAACDQVWYELCTGQVWASQLLRGADPYFKDNFPKPLSDLRKKIADISSKQAELRRDLLRSMYPEPE